MVTWKKEFTGYRRVDRTPIQLFTPVPHDSGELLLEQILAMPKDGRKSIAFDQAAAFFIEHFHNHAEEETSTRESVDYMYNHWVKWVSDRGYWINLQGNEYRVDTWN